jgi:hypothetical protein
LDIFDVQGKRVASLVDGSQTAGEHQVTFDGSGLSSGIYFVKLQAGVFQATEKLVLLK